MPFVYSDWICPIAVLHQFAAQPLSPRAPAVDMQVDAASSRPSRS